MPDPTPPAVATPDEVKEFRSAQEREYGQFVAVAQILFNGAIAYNPGDPVPATNVEKYGYLADGYVAKVGTKAAGNVATSLQAAAVTQVAEVPASVSLNVTVPPSK